MEELVLKKSVFEFDGSTKQLIVGTVIGTKFAPSNTSMSIDEIDTGCFET